MSSSIRRAAKGPRKMERPPWTNRQPLHLASCYRFCTRLGLIIGPYDTDLIWCVIRDIVSGKTAIFCIIDVKPAARIRSLVIGDRVLDDGMSASIQIEAAPDSTRLGRNLRKLVLSSDIFRCLAHPRRTQKGTAIRKSGSLSYYYLIISRRCMSPSLPSMLRRTS